MPVVSCAVDMAYLIACRALKCTCCLTCRTLEFFDVRRSAAARKKGHGLGMRFPEEEHGRLED
eukprot:12058153-Alexandrium_andersonii.AAC.1